MFQVIIILDSSSSSSSITSTTNSCFFNNFWTVKGIGFILWVLVKPLRGIFLGGVPRGRGQRSRSFLKNSISVDSSVTAKGSDVIFCVRNKCAGVYKKETTFL